MRSVYFFVGLLILGLIVLDLIWTTLWVNGGAGPISSRITSFTWRLMRRVSGDKGKLMNASGPIVLVLTLLMWVSLMWIGWTLVFSGAADSISDTMDQNPIAWYERFYFVGYSLFTLGNGNYAPKEGFWQILSTFVSGGGMLFLTLGASYIISVVDAVVQKRAFATTITGISQNVTTLIKEAWNGEDFNRLDLLLVNLSSDLSMLTQQHNAYPLLHYYRSNQSQQSAAIAVVLLDEVLTIIKYGISEEVHPNPVLQKNIRSSIKSYLDTLNFAKIASSDNIPPIPDLKELRDTGVPVVAEEEFKENIEEIEDRRKRLYGLVEANGRDWPV